MDSPSDTKRIESLLENIPHDADVPQLLHEFYLKYIQDVLTLSKAIADRRPDKIKKEDVNQAIKSRENFQFIKPPTRDQLVNMVRNTGKLPPIPDKPGILLPSEESCLLSKNFQVVLPHEEEDVEIN